MTNNYKLIFDSVIFKQLKNIDNDSKNIISKMFDKMEEKGPRAGNLLDSKLYIYEIKNKRPPIRLYYKHNQENNDLYVFEFEMKTSSDKQKQTIRRLRKKISET